MLDLNKPQPEEEDNGTLNGKPLEMEPFIGQTFYTFEEAYFFYKNYAMQQGFTVRKDRSERKNNKTVRRDIYCHRGGSKLLRPIDISTNHRNGESIRCGCNAYIRVTLKKSYDIFPEEWHVTKFTKDHNHKLLSNEEMRFLPVNRIITPEDEKQILLYKDVGINVRQIIRVMELQKQVKHGDLAFLDKNVRNLFTKVKRMLGASDAMGLIEYMESAKQKNIMFQYEYTIDEERRLENLFWCHPQSFEWYKKFGDVVVFDTTYKVNAYDMPCALFVGVNNHGKTVLFGSALLRNETTRTFKWLMKTSVTIMKKPSKTIITDQDPWMSEAILVEMPTTKHSFCIWHITSKFSSWFTALLRTKYQSWCGDFYTLYRMTSVEEFEHNWPLIVAKYNLQNNNHVQGLYKIRQSWAPPYLRDFFFGGMTSTNRSESINAFIKRFVSSHTNLRDFVKQVDLAIDEIGKEETHNKMLATVRPTSIKSKSPIEEQAFKILTPYVFKKFQEEFLRASQYLVVAIEDDKFSVKFFEGGNNINHKVFWDGNIATCSCKNFEFWGILCRHIFRVFFHKDCFKIPSVYLPLRWCSDSSQSVRVMQEVYVEETLLDHEPIILDNISEKENVILCPPKSTTKGRPRKRRLKGGKELANKVQKKCSICRQVGHTKPTCNKENIDVPENTNTDVAQKTKKCLAHDIGLNPVFTLKY